MTLFERIFIKGEKQAFKRIGKYVTITLMVSFIGLGFSTGIKRNLDEKMNDPFINTLEKSLAYMNDRSRLRKFDEIKQDTSFQDSLHIVNLSLLGKQYLPIQGGEDTTVGRYYSRYYNQNFILLDKILDSKNLISGAHHINLDSYGLIVTKGLLDQLGFKSAKYPAFLRIEKTTNDTDSSDKIFYNIPIDAVVNRLPGENAYSATQCYFSNYMAGNFYESLLGSKHNSMRLKYDRFDPRSDTDFMLYFPEQDESKMLEISTKIQAKLENSAMFNDAGYKIKKVDIDSLFTHKGFGKTIRFQMEKPTGDWQNPVKYPDYYECLTMFNIVGQLADIKKYGGDVVLLKNTDQLVKSSYIDEIIKGHILSITLQDLNRVDVIAEAFKDKFDIELEMSKIENGKNYRKVTWLSNISNIIILIISIIAVTLTTFFLLDNYLNSVKTSLGTLMAFGVKDIKRIYLRIIFEYLGWAWLVATAIVFAIQIVLRVINPDEILIYLWSIYYVFLLLVMIALPYAIFRFLDKRLFQRTPGDLIYEREYKGASLFNFNFLKRKVK